jgi:hypothetical protein
MDMHVGMLMGAVIASTIIYLANMYRSVPSGIARVVSCLIWFICVGGLIGHSVS